MALCLLSVCGCATVPERGLLLTDGDFPDPTVWQAPDGRYFATATEFRRLLVSDDLFHWRDSGHRVISDATMKRLREIALRRCEPGRRSRPGVWAPDVARVGNRWILTVAVRTSAQNSQIVVLTSDRPEGPFENPSVLIDGMKERIADSIDPEVVTADGRVWLFFGSLGGIHRIELTADARAVKPGSVPVHVAGRKVDFEMKGRQGSRYNHFEGAYLHRNDGWWYLFASGGRYNDHTYRIVVGRSRTIDGTFVDRRGRPMTAGHAETILASGPDDRLFGPGHNGEIFTRAGREWMFYHVHDRKIPCKGAYVPRPMAVQEIKWGPDGWPFFETGRPQIDQGATG